MEKIFRTKTGFCHVTEDQIILTRDGVAGPVAKVTAGNNIAQVWITYAILSLGLLYLAYNNYQNGNTVTAMLMALLALYLMNGIARSLNNTTTSIIDREDIKTTTFIKGMPGLTRSRFEVAFNEGGKIKKRLILLPGFFKDGPAETNKAVTIMRDAKLLR